jgi:hypothetical protein
MSTQAGRPEAVPAIARPSTKRRALALAFFGGLFFLRVIGQVLVTRCKVKWLPAVEHWQSGLLPYPALLTAQAAILTTMGAIVRDIWRGKGRFARPRPRLGRWLRGFGIAYFSSMVVRYAVTMVMRPQWRWFGHTIPIIFHCILATWLLVYSSVLAGDKPDEAGTAEGEDAPRG